jgi:hypothetical protein
MQTWYDPLDKPRLTPPKAIFGPVWAILYLLLLVPLRNPVQPGILAAEPGPPQEVTRRLRTQVNRLIAGAIRREERQHP